MAKSTMDYELFTPTKVENQHLEKLDQAYLKVSEMTPQERQFLNALVVRNTPRKLVEIGVSAGSSSVILLHALKATQAHLYSIDTSTAYYQDETKQTGYIVDAYPDLLPKWSLFTGDLALKFLPEIGQGIDFCFIDAAHMNPGEILDTLMVLPYLSDDAIIAYHDVNLPTFRQKVPYDINRTQTNNLLMSSVQGHKILQADFDWSNDPRTHFPNIGAIKISQQTKLHVFELVNLLTLKWSYCPSEEEEWAILAFMSAHYDRYLVDYMKRIFAYHRTKPEHQSRLSLRSIAKSTLEKSMGQQGAARTKNAIRKIRRRK